MMEFLDIKEIGKGGMGKIYTAFSSDLNRRVILKTLHPALSFDPRFHARFRREAEILSLLSHPNIVSFIGYETVKIDTHRTAEGERGKKKISASKPLLKEGWREEEHGGSGKSQGDCGQARDREHTGSTQVPAKDGIEELCLVMEQIDGISLQDRLAKKGRMAFSEVLPLFLELCGALRYLHQHTIFHLDLNPGNILLNQEGRLFLTDFGIASTQKEGERTSPLLDPTGTLFYSSPEQVKGENCDGRSDLYSVGMILYALLNGKSYFSGMEINRVWGELVYESKPFQMTFPQEVPWEFQQMIRKLVAKNREERYPEINTLLLEFRRQEIKSNVLLNSQPVISVSFSKKEREPIPEKRMILAAGIIVVFLAFFYREMTSPPISVLSLFPPIQETAAGPVRSTESIHPPAVDSEEPVIQFASLTRIMENKESEEESFPGTLSDNELERALLAFKSGIESENIDLLKKEFKFSPEGLFWLQILFQKDSNPTVEIGQVQQEGASVRVQFQITPDPFSGREGLLVYQNGIWRLSPPLHS